MTTVAVIDDHQVLVDALELLMHSEAEYEFVGSAQTLAAGLELVRKHSPEVLLLDVNLPDGDGINTIPELKKCSPNTQIIVLTSFSDEGTLMRAIDAGVSGFISKSNSLSELMNAIHLAALGEIVIPPSLLSGLLRRIPRSKSTNQKDDKMVEKLTLREQEILKCLAKGMSGTAISEEYNIAPLTVRTHVRNLMSKLGVHSRLEAVAVATREGLIDSV